LAKTQFNDAYLIGIARLRVSLFQKIHLKLTDEEPPLHLNWICGIGAATLLTVAVATGNQVNKDVII
jgi:hypothetical protein